MFQQALAGRDHLVCYAVKANSALAILKLLAERGAGFDIVSGGELERVLAAAPEAVGPRGVFRRGQDGGGDRPGAEGRHSAVQRGERGGAGAAGRACAQAEDARRALRCASIPTSLPIRILISPPDCASTSSASTFARRGAFTRASPATAGLRRTASACTSARRFARRIRLARRWSG